MWLAYTPYYRQNILLFHTFVWFPQKLWSHHKSINLLLTKWTVDLYNNGTGSKLTKEKNPQQVWFCMWGKWHMGTTYAMNNDNKMESPWPGGLSVGLGPGWVWLCQVRVEVLCKVEEEECSWGWSWEGSMEGDMLALSGTQTKWLLMRGMTDVQFQASAVQSAKPPLPVTLFSIPVQNLQSNPPWRGKIAWL